ncbi:MAG: hypothetical protein CM15mP74_23940 [Halieaceae bacterium]|nr:MAG: hypothetical protein CM15mP74_23940 [Halieaceae bacterium]
MGEFCFTVSSGTRTEVSYWVGFGNPPRPKLLKKKPRTAMRSSRSCFGPCPRSKQVWRPPKAQLGPPLKSQRDRAPPTSETTGYLFHVFFSNAGTTPTFGARIIRVTYPAAMNGAPAGIASAYLARR